MSSPKYSIIIAAHNEEGSIGQLLNELTSAFRLVKDYEVFVSEDGSRDKTREIVKRLSSEDSRIRISSNSERRGYSGAIQYGISESRGEILLFLDGDGQTNPMDLVGLIGALSSENQIVVGARNPRVDGRLRILESKLFYGLYRFLGFPKLADPSSGSIICYRKSVLGLIQKDLKLPFGFWWEFQAWAANKNYQVIEIPIPHRERIAGSTQVYLNSQILNIAVKHVKGLFQLRKELRSN